MNKSRCNHFKMPPMTLGEAKRIMGCEPGPDLDLLQAIATERGYGQKQTEEFVARRAKEWATEDEELIASPDDGYVFLCGEIEVQVCGCQTASDYLCDYPVGDGKTCDLPLCDACRKNIGEERDLCAIHYAEWHMRKWLQQELKRRREHGSSKVKP